MTRKGSLTLVFLCLVIVGIGFNIQSPPDSADAARNSAHMVPTWDLTVGNSTHNTTYSLTELLHMPFYSLNGTSGGGGSTTGYWGGVLIRDLIAPYLRGAWEFKVQVESGAYKVNMTYEEATRNDSLLAFWLDSDWLNVTTHGVTRQATLSSSSGSAWTKNVTGLRVIPTNTTIIPREWTLKIDAYRDVELSWDQLIHHGYREMHYGWYKDPPMEFGTYIGQSMKSFLAAYVGPWTQYDVTVIAIDGFTKTWEWDDVVQNDTWFLAYGENGSQFLDLATTGWVRLVALNDSSAKGGQRSAKNISEIIVHPTGIKSEYSSNLTLLDENGGQIAFYDALNLTSLPYLEGPVQVYGGEGSVERGMYLMKGVNVTELMESHFNLTDDIIVSTLGKDGWSVNLSI
ncbi:MAG: hypothetical protein ACW976_07170, partial [Candidatus Ranarchaeia archaeon]